MLKLYTIFIQESVMLNIDFLNNDYSDKRTPAEKAREQIKISILNRELKPGQRLIEQKLCILLWFNLFPVVIGLLFSR